jgi:hypothetical protein
VANLELAKLWLRNCTGQSHESCTRNIGRRTKKPTRLVNVADPARPFLEVERHTIQDPYLALSYSWGHGAQYKTMNDNIEAHKGEIPLHRLAQNFKDAFLVTRRLGYKYLWTDALCIIQDCPVDKGHEIPDMDEIYVYADLTIYAERAEGAHDGLFEHRRTERYKPVEVTFKFPGTHGEHSRKVTLERPCRGKNYLEERGWILQEEILSSRLLIFGKQLSWWCKSCVASETNPLPGKEPKQNRIGVGRFRKNLLVRENGAAGRHYYEMWYAMAEEYSKRKLTNHSDTLPAVDGLASRFAHVHGGSYVQGLWREDMHYGLGWFTSFDPRRLRRRDEYIAPSWSWGSPGKVQFSFITYRLSAQYGMSESEGRGVRFGHFNGTTILEPPTAAVDTPNPRQQRRLSFRGKLERLCLRRDHKLETEKTHHPAYRTPQGSGDTDTDTAGRRAKRQRTAAESFIWFDARFPALVLAPDGRRLDEARRFGQASLDGGPALARSVDAMALPLFWAEIRAMRGTDATLVGVCLLLEKHNEGSSGGGAEYHRLGVALVEDQNWVRVRQAQGGDSLEQEHGVII